MAYMSEEVLNCCVSLCDFSSECPSTQITCQPNKFEHVLQNAEISLIHRFPTLTKTIHINDANKIGKFVVSRKLNRLPLEPSAISAITEQYIGCIW